MASERFCINENSLGHGKLERHVVQASLESFATLLQQCEKETSRVRRSNTVYEVEVLEGLPLAQLLFDPQFQDGWDPVVLHLLQQTLDHTVPVDSDLEDEDINVTVCGLDLESYGISYAHIQSSNGQMVACISASPFNHDGLQKVVREGSAVDVYFAQTLESRVAFYRSIPELEDHDRDTFMAHAELAFPAIQFKAGIAADLSHFSRSFKILRKEVIRHLAILNDYGQRVFREAGPEPHNIQATFSAKHGLMISPESPGTRANPKAMRARKIKILGTEYTCEWHTKLTPQKDRIHFHPNTSPTGKVTRLIVGIFAEHLPT